MSLLYQYTVEVREPHLNRPEPGTVAGRHVLVQRSDSISATKISDLLVHVVCARARIISDPDAKVLNFQRLGLGDLQTFTRALVSSDSFPSLLNSQWGKTKYNPTDTYRVDRDDLAVRLLDLLQ